MAKDKLIGVDLGGTTIKFAILTAEGEIQQKWSIKTNILDEGSHIVPDTLILLTTTWTCTNWTRIASLVSEWVRQERLILRTVLLRVLST